MILIIDCGSSYISFISKSLNKLNIKNKKISADKLQNIFDLIKSENIKGIIGSGGPTILTKEPDEYFQKFQFIKDLDVPFLGICLSHQILGHLFGAQLLHGERIKLDHEINIIKADPLFKDLPKSSIFTENHCEYIDLPKNFLLLASSKPTEVEVIKHKTKPLYGVQFHPEVSGQNGLTLLKNFYELCFN
ncbi:C26 family cysteine hydrolase domain-containing family [Candidatus Woesearchaeota archaeon]|nr:C26 family cysteine hydrolase domain-containing family [Candidatus Woesearchaeota archaeon]MBT7367971.1 C26 family cysteine hydrolase domain-containing family [Candidatus Woesearchaeota archaeon]